LCVHNAVENIIEAGYNGELAIAWKRRMRMKKAVEGAKKKAEGGDADAMESLGFWYATGTNELPVDEEISFQWQNKAAVQRLKDRANSTNASDAMHAMYEVGEVFFFGIFGMKADRYEAYRWFKKSADNGYPAGLATVGCFQFNGWGTNKDIASGLALIASAARDGSALACYMLGKFFYKSRHGIKKDVKQAKKWLKMALGNGEERCKYNDLNGEHIVAAHKWLREIEQEEQSR